MHPVVSKAEVLWGEHRHVMVGRLHGTGLAYRTHLGDGLSDVLAVEVVGEHFIGRRI